MSIIGKVQQKTTKRGDELEGYVSTLQFNFRFRLARIPKTENPKAPAYRIVSWSDSGVEVEIGAAWIKTMTKAGREGEEFLTLTFSDPSFPKPLNVAAFKSADSSDWDITFRHRQGGV